MKPSTLATLMITCPDRRGLVAGLAQVLSGHGANIVDSDQHTDRSVGCFFQRIAFETADLATDRNTLERAVAEVAARFSMTYNFSYAEGPKKRMAIFVSKYDHCLYDLLLRHKQGELACELALVISNHTDLEPVARQFGVPFFVFPKTKESKEEVEKRELELLADQRVDLIVLARYMQILSDNFVSHFPSAVINIHHSFLPAFMGARPYHRAHERGVKLIGATAHYATAQLDEGPIIAQDVVHCSHRDEIDDLVRKGRDLERIVLGRAVRAHLDNRVLTYANKSVVFE